MKIRILKNDPPKNAMGASDISGYIGKVFEASIHEEGVVVSDDSSGIDGAIIFNGEYEIVENDDVEDKTIKINEKYYSERELAEIIKKANMYDNLSEFISQLEQNLKKMKYHQF